LTTSTFNAKYTYSFWVFVVRRNGKLQFYVRTIEGSELQAIGETLDIRGAADWSPDGKWVVAGAVDASVAGLFKIPAEGGAPVRLYTRPSSIRFGRRMKP